jgi:hypothetical protein
VLLRYGQYEGRLPDHAGSGTAGQPLDGNDHRWGYDLADIDLAGVPGGGDGTLAPGHFFSSIRATGRFQRPPDGEYNVFMYVSQFPQTNTILDSIAFPEKLRIGRTGNGGGYCGLGPEMALVVPLCFALRRSIRRRRARAG